MDTTQQSPQSFGDMFKQDQQDIAGQGQTGMDSSQAMGDKTLQQIQAGSDAAVQTADSVQLPAPSDQVAPSFQPFDLSQPTAPPAQGASPAGGNFDASGFDLGALQEDPSIKQATMPKSSQGPVPFAEDPAAPPTGVWDFIKENVGKIFKGNAEERKPTAPHPEPYEVSAKMARAGVSQSMTGEGWKLDKATQIKALTPYYEGRQGHEDLSALAPPVLAASYDFVAMAQKAGLKPIITSGKRAGDPGYHGYGEAIDVVLVDKNGKDIGYGDKEQARVVDWARQAGWATVLNEGAHPIPGHSQGPGHYHLAWGNDGTNLPGATQLTNRHPGDKDYLKPSAGQPANFADAINLVAKADLKTIPGKAARAAELYGLDPDLFARQIQAESGFKDQVNPETGARGWAQFMPATGAEIADKMGVPLDQFYSNPMIQLKGAAYYMKQLATQFGGNVALASAAYNWGPGNIQRFVDGKASLPPETKAYVYNVYHNRFPNELPNIGAVEGWLRSGKAPMLGQAPTKTEAQQFSQEVAHPVGKVWGTLFPETKVSDVASGLVDKLPEGNTKAALQALTGFTMDTAEGPAHMGGLNILKNMTDSFIDSVTMGWTHYGDQNSKNYKLAMGDLRAEHPWVGGFMEGSDAFVRHGLPMIGGMIATTEALLAGGGLLPGAAGKFFQASRKASDFLGGVAKAEAGESGVLAGMKNWYTASGGANKILASTYPQALAIGLDQGGRTAIALSQKGDVSPEDILKESMWSMFLGSATTMMFNILAPLSGQVILGSALRSPGAAGAMGQILSEASPTGKNVMKTVGGGIAGIVTSQVANFASQMTGGELDISPWQGAGMGIIGALATEPMANGLRGLSSRLATENPAVHATLKGWWDNTWKSMQKAYEGTATDEVIADMTNIARKAEAYRVNVKSANRWEEMNRTDAEARLPGIEGMERQGKLITGQHESIKQQRDTVKADLDVLDSKLQGSPLPGLYEDAQKKVSSYAQDMAKLDQQKAQIQQTGANPQQLNAVQSSIKALTKDHDAAVATIKEISEKNPEVIRIGDIKAKHKVLEAAEKDAAARVKEYQENVGPVLSAEKRWSEAQLAEADRLAKMTPDMKADPSFNLAHQSKLLDYQHGPGEVPPILGVDSATVAQIATENLHQQIKSMTNRIQTEGDRIWDEEFNMKGRQISRAAATREGSTSDVFITQKYLEHNNIANMDAEKLGPVIYGKRQNAYYNYGKPQFNEVLEPQTLKWKTDQMVKYGGTRANKAAATNPKQTLAVRTSYLLQAIKENGYDLDRLRGEIATTRSKGMQSYLDILPVEAEGAKVGEYRGRDIQTLNVSKELAHQTLAAESVGDQWVPIQHDTSEGVKDYVKFRRLQEIKEFQKAHAHSAAEVLGFAADRQQQIILDELYGSRKKMGDTVISEPLHPTTLANSVISKLVSPPTQKTNPVDHMAEMRQYFTDKAAKDPSIRQAIIGAISEEVQLLGRLGEGLSGGGKGLKDIPQAELTIGAPVKGTAIAMSKDGTRQYVFDPQKAKDGTGGVEVVQRKTVASGADVTKMSLGLDGYKASPNVSQTIDLIKGNHPLSDQKSRIVFTEDTLRKLEELKNSPKVMTAVEARGATGKIVVETQMRAKHIAEQLGDDLKAAVDESHEVTYASLHEDIKAKHSSNKFMSDVVDMIENPSLGAEVIKRYGEPAKQMATDILEATKAIDQVRTSSAWADKTSRSSYFMHQYPSLRTHIMSKYGEEGNAGFSVHAAVEDVMRDYPTLKAVRDEAQKVRDTLTGRGTDPKEFVNMTPEQRVAEMGVETKDMTPAQRKKAYEKVNTMSSVLVMEADTKTISAGDVLANKLSSVYQQEGTRQMLEMLMRSKVVGTVGKDGVPATLLYHAKDSNTARVVDTPTGKQSYQTLDQSGQFGSSEVTLFGESVKTKDLMIHPMAASKLNNYFGSYKPPAALKLLKDIVNMVNQANLLGGIPAHLFQTMEAVMGETMAGFYSAAGKMTNLPGVGMRVRNRGVEVAGDGRLYELYAIKHGLNAKSLANSSFDIAQTALESLGDEFGAKVHGVGNTEVEKFLQTLDPRNPLHKEARKFLKGMWAGSADIINTPTQMEHALQRQLTFQAIRDGQVAAFYARAGHFMDSVPELQKIVDPSERFSAALRASAEVANQQAGSIPYHRMHKLLREGLSLAQLTPGWFFTQANNLVESIQALGYWSLGPVRNLAPKQALWLREQGLKLRIGQGHPDLPPEVAAAVKERIVRNVAGVSLASVLYTETFNLWHNGRTSYQEADANAAGKQVIGNGTMTTPFFGYVRRLVRLLHKGAAQVEGVVTGHRKTDQEGENAIVAELVNSLSPFWTKLVGPAISEASSPKNEMEANLQNEATMFAGVPGLAAAERIGKKGLGMATKTMGMNEVFGFRDKASAKDVAMLGMTDASQAQRLPPADYVAQQAGFSISRPNIPRNIIAAATSKESHYEQLAAQQLDQFYKAAYEANGETKKNYFLKLADQARAAGIPITDPEVIAGNGGRKTFYLSQEAANNIALRYFNPGAALGKTRGITREMVKQRVWDHEGTSTDPYQALIKQEEPGENQEETP